VPLFAALVDRGGRLFRTHEGHPYPLTEDGGGQLKTAINGARRRSGIAGISPYTARHTVSTQLVVNGVHPHIKDQILGHAVDDMSRHYTQVPQAPLIAAINTLPVPDEWRSLEWWRDPISWSRKLQKWGKVINPNLFLPKGPSLLKARKIGGLPSYWTDASWVTHSCQRAEVEPGIFLVWTDCGRDVPANAANTPEPGETVTCVKCLAALGNP
jgi:hypothetical protein